MNISDMILIGSGAQADVYLYQDKAIKVFKPTYHQGNAYKEAELQDKVYKTGLPVPAIYEISEINGRSVIVMEYMQGKPLGGKMLSEFTALRQLGFQVKGIN